MIAGSDASLGGGGPLVDVHAHFHHARGPHAGWRRRNDARMLAGERIGISVHIASILGTWGESSPVYFPSPADVTLGNDAMLALQRADPERIRSYVVVNPNETTHASEEIERCISAGAVGIKLAASRRADDPLVDRVAEAGAQHGVPILHHIWQHRRREWPEQEISDGVDLARLATRHPGVHFILAHIGGGGDWAHTFPAVDDVPNILLDLSGSGTDRGMLDDALRAVGADRLLWGADVTLETGLAKLWALEQIGMSADESESVRWRNALRIFPEGTLPLPHAAEDAA